MINKAIIHLFLNWYISYYFVVYLTLDEDKEATA